MPYLETGVRLGGFRPTHGLCFVLLARVAEGGGAEGGCRQVPYVTAPCAVGAVVVTLG